VTEPRVNSLVSILAVALAAAGLSGCKSFEPKPLAPAESGAALENRTLDDPALRDFIAANSGRPLDAWPPSRWDFTALTLAACYYHPSLASARAQWHVAQAEVVTTGGRPNPTVGVTPGYNFNPASGVTPWLPAVTFDLPIETAGKRGYRIAKARHLAESARLRIASVAWQVRRNLRASLIDFATAGAREALLAAQEKVQTEIVRRLEQRLAAGAVSPVEVTQARVTLNKTRVDSQDTRAKRAEARARVAEAIGVPLRALDGVELAFEVEPRPVAAGDLTATELRRVALQSRADVLAALAEYEASQSALQLEIAKQYPDVHLGTGYQWDQSESKWQLGLSAELPVLNRNQGPIAESEARRAEAATRVVATQASVIAQIDTATAGWRALQSQLATLDELVSGQQRLLDSVRGQAQAGAADPLDVFLAELEAGQVRLARLEGAAKAWRVFGQLEDALQRPVDSINWRQIEEGTALQIRKESKP